MKDNNSCEKNNPELLILELARLCNQYRHLYRGVRTDLREAMPEVYECFQSYRHASEKIKDKITMFMVIGGIIILPMFIVIMHEYGFTINGLINFVLAFLGANLGGYGINLILDKRAREALKETIESIKYVKEHKQEYKIANEKVKQYKEEIIPERKRKLDETNDLLVQQLELIKKTTSLIAADEKCCDEYGECNFELLYDILDNYNLSQKEPTKTISRVKKLSGTPANFKVKMLVRK